MSATAALDGLEHEPLAQPGIGQCNAAVALRQRLEQAPAHVELVRIGAVHHGDAAQEELVASQRRKRPDDGLGDRGFEDLAMHRVCQFVDQLAVDGEQVVPISSASITRTTTRGRLRCRRAPPKSI